MLLESPVKFILSQFSRRIDFSDTSVGLCRAGFAFIN